MNQRENRRFAAKVVGGGLGGLILGGAIWLFFAVLSLSISLGVLAAACWVIVMVLRHLGVAI